MALALLSPWRTAPDLLAEEFGPVWAAGRENRKIVGPTEVGKATGDVDQSGGMHLITAFVRRSSRIGLGLVPKQAVYRLLSPECGHATWQRIAMMVNVMIDGEKCRHGHHAGRNRRRDVMVAALVRWQFALTAGDPFTDAPAERVIGNVALREGPQRGSSWAGRSSRRNARRCNWYSTTLTGITPSAPAWRWGRAVEYGCSGRPSPPTPGLHDLSAASRTLSHRNRRQPDHDYSLGRCAVPVHVGEHSRQRLIINQTPQSIMTVLCDAAGMPAADRDFDTLATLYNRRTVAGICRRPGSADDGRRVHLRRAGQGTAGTASHPRGQSRRLPRYTDGDPTAAELGVPAPRRLTRPFGIINHVDGEYHYYTPANANGPPDPYNHLPFASR